MQTELVLTRQSLPVLSLLPALRSGGRRFATSAKG